MLVVQMHLFIHYFSIHTPVDGFLSSFRMPLYFILSGLFFKPYDGFVGFCKRKTNKLLIPFVFFYMATSVPITNLLSVIGDNEQQISGVESLYAFITKEYFSNLPIWFLLCLFWVNLLFYGLYTAAKRMTKSDRAFVAVISALSLGCGAIGYLMFYYKVNLWAYVDSTFTSIPFYCFGFLLRKYTNILTFNAPNKWLLPLLVVGCFVLTYVFKGSVTYMSNTYNTSPVVAFLGGVFGTLAVLFLSKMIGRLPFVSHWGRYSIIILCTHMLLMRVFYLLAVKAGVISMLGELPSAWLIFVVVMFASELTIPFCIRFIPWFTAQKDFIKV